jgi:hypothetical protein
MGLNDILLGNSASDKIIIKDDRLVDRAARKERTNTQ